MPVWEPTDHQFDSLSGHMLELQARSPVWGHSRGKHTLMSPSLPFSLSKMSKIFFKITINVKKKKKKKLDNRALASVALLVEASSCNQWVAHLSSSQIMYLCYEFVPHFGYVLSLVLVCVVFGLVK